MPAELKQSGHLLLFQYSISTLCLVLKTRQRAQYYKFLKNVQLKNRITFSSNFEFMIEIGYQYGMVIFSRENLFR